MQFLRKYKDNPGFILLGVLLLIMIATVAFGRKAWSADKGGKPAPSVFDEIVPKATTWSGCGLAGRGGWSIVSADVSPVTYAAEGGKAGAGAFCDWQAGKHFLIGAFVNYDWAFGDLKTIGINTDLTAGMRVGMPLSKNVMPYMGGAFSRVDVNGLGNVDGWKALAGIEVRLATDAPLYFAVEASRGFYKDMDTNTTDIMASIKIRPFSN